jgi:putative ABC transport system ATP-binding protein
LIGKEKHVLVFGKYWIYFSNFNLIDELSVYDNIELPLIYNSVKAGKKIKSRSNAEKLNIAHRLKHSPTTFWWTTMAVARALINDPKMADEPWKFGQ